MVVIKILCQIVPLWKGVVMASQLTNYKIIAACNRILWLQLQWYPSPVSYRIKGAVGLVLKMVITSKEKDLGKESYCEEFSVTSQFNSNLPKT